ncbi:hypothetical protein HPB52_022471 [Rhipicephalus sanguineus]|uniref:Uncharacterized protein n=1 Tax=Rhipicephalus sanguineus TaxID=34632 RepID=A0A9D4T207_RHISA|nr:hypothetical protein HPB52_022471 [Rhipicephalus sanguineus]
MSTYFLLARVVVIGGSMVVSPDFRNMSQSGYFLCDHPDEDRAFEILHAEYNGVKHAKNALRPIRVGPKHAHKECKGRKSSYDDDVNEMEDNLTQVNDLNYVPLFKPLQIGGQDTSVVPLEESHEASKLLDSALGLEETCMKSL